MTPPSPAGPPRRRFWRSARTRFELLTIALVAAVVTALVVVQAIRIEQGLTSDLTEELDEELEEITRIAGEGPKLLAFELDHERSHFEAMLVLDASGAPRWPADADPGLVAVCRALHDAGATDADGVLRRRWAPAGAAAPIRLVFGPMGAEWLCLGRSEAHIQAAVARFQTTGAVLGALAIVILWLGIHRITAGVFRPIADITERAAHLSARRLSERVPVTGTGDELDRLAVLLNEMLERLERSFAALVRFTADASHQLRTPLATIRLAVERALASDDPEDTAAALDATIEEAVRLQTMVRALLELARAEASEPLQLQPVALDDVVADRVALVRPLADERGIVLEWSGAKGVGVSADATLLREAVTVLIENALQYTPDGGTIQVAVAAEPGTAVVRVADTGIGIPADERERIFEPFFRGRGVVTLAPGGHGLGLSMAAAIARRHGGSLELAASSEPGSTFVLRLPRVPVPVARAPAGPSPA